MGPHKNYEIAKKLKFSIFSRLKFVFDQTAQKFNVAQFVCLYECKRHEPGHHPYPGGPVHFPVLMCDLQLRDLILQLFQNLSCLVSLKRY